MGYKHKKKRVSAKRTVPAPPWTDEEIDIVLDEMLPLDNPKQLHLWQSQLSQKFKRGMVLHHTHKHYGIGRSRKSIEFVLYKVGTGYGKFRRYVPQNRTPRKGKPITWMEYDLLKAAFDPNRDAAKAAKYGRDPNRIIPMTVEFMALVLQRPVEQIRHERYRIQGKFRPTFGLVCK